jgi:hypothetical protein
MDAYLSLQKALIAHLKSLTSLRVWLGNPTRVYDEVPPNTGFPYIALSRSQSQPFSALSLEADEQVITLMCVSRFSGTEEAKAILAELRVNLDQVNLTLEGHRLVNPRVSFTDVFRSADQKTIYGLLRWRAVTEPV